MKQASNPTLNFKDLFYSLGVAYIVFEANDPIFTVLEENQAHANMAMVERDKVIGKPLLEAFPDTSIAYITKGESRLLASIRKVIATGVPDTISDLNYDLKDQQGVLVTKFWEVTHYPVYDGGTIRAVCQQTKDVTESVMARKELSIAKDQLEQALEYSEVGTWMWDLRQNIVIGDKNLAKLFGLNAGTDGVKLPLENLTKSVHPDDRVRTKKEIAKALSDKSTAFESEYRTFDFEGNIRWLLARGHVEVDAAGKPVRFPGLVVDITERKEAENSLHILAKTNTQFSAALGYRQTLDAIASMIVPDVADWCSIDILEKGKIEQIAVAHSDPKKVKWAKQLRAKQGPVDVHAPSGTPWVIRTGKVEYIPVITDDMLRAAARDEKELQLLRDLDFHSIITAPLKIDGKSIGAISFVSTESHRHYDENDVEIAQALANRAALAVYNANLFQDAKAEISERKKLQQKLEKFNATLEGRVKDRTLQLEKTNKGLEDEIKSRHKLEKQRLQHYIDLNKTKDEFISLASHQLRTPATGVKQYLGMVVEGMAGDITEQQRSLLMKAFESNERQLTIVSDLLKVAQVDAGKMKLRPRKVNIADIIADVVKEQGDTYSTRRQVLDFPTPPFTPIANVDPDKMRMVFENIIDNASKYSEPGKSIRVACRNESDAIVVEIKDNGVGIAPDDITRLFEKFNRIHNHLSNHVGGTGLGLYWAKKVVDLHGGIIQVTSELGKGSTFSVCLPKHEKLPLQTVTTGGAYEK
ncbi:MAG: ATP-binding protein [Candidatus Saccharimonas sp.]